MSITLYSKYRRQNLRRAWKFAGMTEWILNVGLWIAGLIVALAVVAWIDDQSEKEDLRVRTQARVNQMENVLISCLQHKGFFMNGELHLCEIGRTGIKQQ